MVSCCCSEALRDPSCKVPWSSFCADPWSAAEALHDKGCIKRSKSYLYFHMEDQLHCMRTAAGDWAVDFIGRVDEPNEDWAEVGGAVRFMLFWCYVGGRNLVELRAVSQRRVVALCSLRLFLQLTVSAIRCVLTRSHDTMAIVRSVLLFGHRTQPLPPNFPAEAAVQQ